MSNLPKYTIKIQEEHRWIGDTLDCIQKMIVECDNQRINEICDHFQCDMSEFKEWLQTKRNPFKTNADRIHAMSDEELAKAFSDYISCHNCPIPYCKVRFTMERLGCQENWLDWLKEEVE